MEEDTRRPLKIVLAVVVLVILLFIGSVVYHLLSTATVTLVTNDPANYLKVSQVLPPASKSSAFSAQAQGKLSARVKPGTYQISVTDQHDQDSSSRTVTIKARQHPRFTLNISLDISSPEPVYGDATSGVIADSGTLLFVDQGDPDNSQPGSNNLVKVDSSNNFSILFPQISFRRISWANTALGLGQGINNNLYVIEGVNISQLSLPFAVTSSTTLSSVITSSGVVYVSNGQAVYSGTVSGNFKQVYATTTGDPGLGLTITPEGASNRGLALVRTGNPNVRGEDDASGLVVINNEGGVTKSDVDTDSLSWSPSGTYMVVIGDSGNLLLNSSFQQIGTVPGNDSTVYAWLNDNTLLYNVDSQLWQYNVQSRQSQKLAELDAKETITAIYPSADGSYIYFSDNNTEKTQLFRVGLKGQPVNNSLASLGIFLPETLGNCQLNYINFARPSMVISYPSSGSQQNCLSLAQGELQTYNLDINDFQYKFVPQPAD